MQDYLEWQLLKLPFSARDLLESLLKLQPLNIPAGSIKPFYKLADGVNDNDQLDIYFFNKGDLSLEISEDMITFSLKRDFKLSANSKLNEHEQCRKNLISGKAHFTFQLKEEDDEYEYNLKFHQFELFSSSDNTKLEKESQFVQVGLETLFKVNFKNAIQYIHQIIHEHLLQKFNLKFSDQKIVLTTTSNLSLKDVAHVRANANQQCPPVEREISREELSKLPEPYNKVNLLPYNHHHWFHNHNARSITRFINIYPVKTVIEVGTWMGGSTRYMAELLPVDGVIYGIDTFAGSKEEKDTYHRDEITNTLYDQFLSNAIRTKVADKIKVIKGDSLEVAKQLKKQNLKADLIYIDAGHSYSECYADIIAYYKMLSGPKILCGDDYSWPGVKQAVDQFAKEIKLEPLIVFPFWAFFLEDQHLNSNIHNDEL